MTIRLSNNEVFTLIKSVFKPGREDKNLALAADVPNQIRADHDKWRDRRNITEEWYLQISEMKNRLGLRSVDLYLYENVESNNADLPVAFYPFTRIPEDISASGLKEAGEPVVRDEILKNTQIMLFLTEYSATAPLKMLAKQYPFRAATMPGFSREMLPALGLDYSKIHDRVMVLKTRLDRAESAHVIFETKYESPEFFIDLRNRTAHASSGLITEAGTAGNLPSGETYIVPYEGEIGGIPSKTEGVLPVVIGQDLLFYHVRNNRVEKIEGEGKSADEQRTFMRSEPAYGNIAEFGLGILDSFGISAVGSVLLDEKLGLHIALGRSDHFGGITGPAAFVNPKNVIHFDYVYVPSLQPGIRVKSVRLDYPDGDSEIIMENGNYTV